MAFTLPPLPYAYDALEPAIDSETMTFHHDKHHQAYVDNLNKAVDADPALRGKSMEEMFATISTLPKAVRNNAGGHWNHSLFWKLLAPSGKTGRPSPELAAAIEAGDADETGRLLHGIKGSAAYLDEGALHVLCADMEAAADARNWAVIEEGWPRLRGMLDGFSVTLA